MKKIPIKSGGHAFICESKETFLPGEVCFLASEWEYAKRLANGFREPEEVKAYWQNVLQKKRECSTYLVTDDFPIIEPEKKPKPGALVDFVGGIIEKLRSEGKLKP